MTKEDGKAASAFSTFSGQLANTSVPASAAADKARLIAAAAASAQDYIQLSKTTSTSQYQSTFASIGLQQTLTASTRTSRPSCDPAAGLLTAEAATES